MFEYVFEVRPEGRSWRVASPSLADAIRLETFAQAERRARWLAIRQEVRGYPAVIRMLDTSGDLLGLWRGERYTAGQAREARHAA